MTSRNSKSRKAQPDPKIRLRLKDLKNVEFELPPILANFGMKFVIQFDGKSIKSGLVKHEVTFDHSMAEVNDTNMAVGVVNSITATEKEDRGHEMAISLVGPKTPDPILDSIAQKALNMEVFGKALEKLYSDVVDREEKTPLGIASKEVLLRVIKLSMEALRVFKLKPKEFELKVEAQRLGVPSELIGRLCQPGLDSKQKELISFFFPNDAKKHLCLTNTEIENGALEVFKEILFPQNFKFVEFLQEHAMGELNKEIQKGTPKASTFQWRFIPPYGMARMYKHRETVFYRERADSPLYQFEAWNMAFYGVPVTVMATGVDLIRKVTRFLWGKDPKTETEKRESVPEDFNHKVFEQDFFVKYLAAISDYNHADDFKAPAPPVLGFPADKPDWKVAYERGSIIKKPKLFDVKKGTEPVRGPESEALIQKMRNSDFKGHGKTVVYYLSHFKGELQQHIAKVLYTQLFLGDVKVGDDDDLIHAFDDEDMSDDEQD